MPLLSPAINNTVDFIALIFITSLLCCVLISQICRTHFCRMGCKYDTFRGQLRQWNDKENYGDLWDHKCVVYGIRWICSFHKQILSGRNWNSPLSDTRTTCIKLNTVNKVATVETLDKQFESTWDWKKPPIKAAFFGINSVRLSQLRIRYGRSLQQFVEIFSRMAMPRRRITIEPTISAKACF